MTPPLRSLRNGSDDVESYILSTPYESSVDTMSCCRTLELPPTPKSTTTFQQLIDTSSVNMDLKKKVLWDKFVDHNVDSYSMIQQQQQNRPCSGRSLLSNTTTARYWIHDDGALAQTEEARGSKADAADLFIMTKPVDSTCISMPEARRSAWWLCSKDLAPTRLNWLDKTCNYFTKKIPEKVSLIIFSLSYTKRTL